MKGIKNEIFMYFSAEFEINKRYFIMNTAKQFLILNSSFLIGKTPYEGGDGVYTARIMINFNPDDYGVAFRLQPEKANNVDKNGIKLYPNPAQDILNIEFENPAGEAISGVLKVFNLSGKLIFEKQLNTNDAFYMLDISSLNNGAYIFSIQINNAENTAYRQQSGKLIVLKP